MTNAHVALLRGINVGKAKRIAMGDLRELVEALGYGDVRTLLNSGNVVFSVPAKMRGDHGPRIEGAITRRLGVVSRDIVLTGNEVAEIVRENPLGKVANNPSLLFVMVLGPSFPKAQLQPLMKQKWAPEAFGLGRRVAYLWCPGGSIESPLNAAVQRIVGDAGTVRNIATMTKLHGMTGDS